MGCASHPSPTRARQFHVNETGTLMILRLYLWARVLRNHSGYYSRMVAFIGAPASPAACVRGSG